MRAEWMRTRAGVAVALLLVLAAAGCGGSEGATTAGKPEGSGTPATPAAEAAAKMCGGGRGAVARKADPKAIRASFVPGIGDPGEGLHLLLEATELRPGQSIELVVANDSREGVLYGYGPDLRNAESKEMVSTGIGATILIGLIADPGAIGPCITLALLDSTPPGRYEVVVPVSDARRPGREETKVVAEIEVAGNPVSGEAQATTDLKAESANETLVEAAGPGASGIPLKEASKLGQTLFGERLIKVEPELTEDQHHSILNLVVLDADERDADRLEDALAKRPDLQNAVALISTPYTPDETKAQQERLQELIDSQVTTYTLTYEPTTGITTLDIPEITQAQRDEIASWDGPPIAVTIAAPPEEPQ